MELGCVYAGEVRGEGEMDGREMDRREREIGRDGWEYERGRERGEGDVERDFAG